MTIHHPRLIAVPAPRRTWLLAAVVWGWCVVRVVVGWVG